MLRSVLDHSGVSDVHIHFFHDPALPRSVLDRLRALTGLTHAQLEATAVAPELVKDLHATTDITRPAWYRSFLPNLRPQLDRILYLDCDTLVVDSLRPLWETPLAGLLVAAVRNVIEPKLATRHHALGIPEDQPYFNSGVLLMNLELMRHENCTARIVQHARRHGSELIWADQDSLNYVLGARCHYLHPRWNCQNSLFFWPEARETFGAAVVDEAVQRPAILHFEGPGFAKPWHYLNRHPYRRKYWQHLRATPFPVPPQEGRTLQNMLTRYSAPLRKLRPALLGLFRRAVSLLRR